MAPAASDVRQIDTVVHQDTRGGANQSLRALCGSDGGGFAVVWQDQRDAMLGLYLLRLDPSGEPLEPERPIHEPHAGRRLDPAVALAPDGSGAVAWTAPRMGTASVAWLRLFDAKGRFVAPDMALRASGTRENPARPSRRNGASKPALVRRRDGGYAVSWTENGKVELLETDAAGVRRDKPAVLDADAPRAEPGVRLAVEKGGGLLCAWKTGEQYVALALGQSPDPARKIPQRAARSCGEGDLEKLVPDPEGGLWSLFRVRGVTELQHLSPSGEVDRPVIRSFDRSVTEVDLAPWHGGITLLSRSASGRLELLRLGPDGHELESTPTDVLPPEARGAEQALVASNGSTLFVAWTDLRNGDPDVYGRTIDLRAPPERRLGPARRLNSDTASADQICPAIAGAGPRAVIAWQDARDVEPRVYARLLRWPGGFSGDEFELPVAVEGAGVPGSSRPGGKPAVSMRADGDFLVAWVESLGKQSSIRAQLFRADGRPAGMPLLVEQSPGAPPSLAAVALPGDRGHALTWGNLGEPAIYALRCSPEGTLASEPRRIAGGPGGGVQGPSIASLEGDRLLATWSCRSKEGVWSLRARFLDTDCVPQGDEIVFEPTAKKQDWDPSVAPAKEGGFVMSWCSGAPDDFSRDVVARMFDAQGRPSGPLLPISPILNEQDHPHIVRLADGTWAVAWEDDVSGHDHTYLRRIETSGNAIGPIVRINGLETRSVEDRQGPVIAPLTDGLAAIWSDRSRSKGWDVFLKVLGPRFDEVRRH
jgi:hypothetical protein